MTKVFGVDANNDMYLDDTNNLAILNGLSAVTQACETASRTQLGECVLMTGLGLPNFQSIWVGSPNFNLWQSYLTTTLNGVNGVELVQGVTAGQIGDKLKYQATIQTLYGTTALNGVVGG